MSSTAIVIPARFGSTRLPGKPLALLAGRPMLLWVVDIAKEAAAENANTTVVVATDDERVQRLCDESGVAAVMTSPDCENGTERVHDALEQMKSDASFVMNFQGDAPLTPPWFLSEMISAAQNDPTIEVITPVVQLTWEELDLFREEKTVTPFSGTTCVRGANGKAFWFSKNIIPANRHEAKMRTASPLSPVYRHIGLYGYRRDVLARYVTLPPSPYELLEGLEQLRLIENGITVSTVVVDYRGRPQMAGVDSPVDLERAEALLKGM